MSSIRLNNFDTHIVVSQMDQSNSIDHIPAMVYTMTISPDGKLIMFKDRPKYEVPVKKYGDHQKYFDRITKAYDPESRAVGVILDGVKGAGKSLLAEDMANWMIKRDFPVLVIDHKIPASILLAVLQLIGPAMVYFDEFGKMYDDEAERDRMLTLFSDSGLRGTLFVVTSNDTNELSGYMINRPGRFLYRINYDSMEGSVAREIAVEMGMSPWQADIVRDFATNNNGPTFDQVLTLCRQMAGLKSIAEIMEAVSILNIPPLMFPMYGVVKATLDDKGIKRNNFTNMVLEDDLLKVEVITDDGNIAYCGDTPVTSVVMRGSRMFFTSPCGRLKFECDNDHSRVPFKFGIGGRYEDPKEPVDADRGLDRPGSLDNGVAPWVFTDQAGNESIDLVQIASKAKGVARYYSEGTIDSGVSSVKKDFDMDPLSFGQAYYPTLNVSRGAMSKPNDPSAMDSLHVPSRKKDDPTTF